jgi:hypothetical protein
MRSYGGRDRDTQGNHNFFREDWKSMLHLFLSFTAIAAECRLKDAQVKRHRFIDFNVNDQSSQCDVSMLISS